LFNASVQQTCTAVIKEGVEIAWAGEMTENFFFTFESSRQDV